MRAITLRLDEANYRQLAAVAKRQGTAPEALAAAYVRAGLAGDEKDVADRRRAAGLAALRGLAAFRERLLDVGPIDVVQLVQEGRQDLERRMAL